MDIIIELEKKTIKIDGSVICLMNSYKQLENIDKEAGGILIGRENKGTGNLIIEYATEPYDGDKRSRTSYHRKDKKHIEFYNELYERYKGIYAYVGEWHTHPEDYPNYSPKDLRNWKKISKINEEQEKLYYHLIIGNEEIRIWEYRINLKKPMRIY